MCINTDQLKANLISKEWVSCDIQQQAFDMYAYCSYQPTYCDEVIAREVFM